MVEKGAERSLNARQRAFVQAVSNPVDARSIGQKAEAAGFNALYGYRLARIPHVAAAIEQETRAHVQLLRARAGRVLAKLADSAEQGNTRAAELFLTACGLIPGRGTTINNQVTASAEFEPLADRLRKIAAERNARYAGFPPDCA